MPLTTTHGNPQIHPLRGSSCDYNSKRTFVVAIPTRRRQSCLADLLADLQSMMIDFDAATWIYKGIIVIDNDAIPSAEETVLSHTGGPTPIRYLHEPEPGLAAVRNRALDEAGADVLVFIDDDERPGPGWPGGLLTTMAATGAALVGGPVRTAFTHRPPAWVTTGRFFDRPEPPDRTPQTWLRTGNLAVDVGQIRTRGLRFDPGFSFTGGEDTAFTLAAARAGLELQWSASAAVTELVGPERTTLRWLARRERRSTASWVRIELGRHPGPGRRILVAARAGVRLAEGGLLTAGGLLLGRRVTVARGCLRAARGTGAVLGLAGRTGGPAYGPGARQARPAVRCNLPPHTPPVEERPS